MTSLRSGYRLIDVPESRLHDVITLATWAFPSSVPDEQLAALPNSLSWDRTRAVETDDGELVAIYSSFPFTEFPVPGARAATAGLAWVGVHPAHRRRGILTAMIDDHFSRSLARGEVLSALHSAEPAIYGRFGYGLAAHSLHMTIDRRAALRDVAGADQLRVRIECLDPERHDLIIAAVHTSIDRPGWATRQTPELRAGHLADPEPFRDGRESRRIAIVTSPDGDTPLGYALFSRKCEWKDECPQGSVWVREAVAPDAPTARALWGVLLDLDLMATVGTQKIAPDDPLTHLLVDPRAARPRWVDDVWVRLLDVPAALAARRYAAPLEVVLDVRDALLPANNGRWRVVGGPDGAQVAAVGTTPDLSLDVRELGAAYLGGISLAGLASAGLVTEHTPGALHTAAVAFGWPVAPMCSWMF